MATVSEKIDEVQARAGRFILRWKDSRNQLTDVEYAGYRPDETSLEVFHDGTLALGVNERVGGRYIYRRLLCESEGARAPLSPPRLAEERFQGRPISGGIPPDSYLFARSDCACGSDCTCGSARRGRKMKTATRLKKSSPV